MAVKRIVVCLACLVVLALSVIPCYAWTAEPSYQTVRFNENTYVVHDRQYTSDLEINDTSLYFYDKGAGLTYVSKNVTQAFSNSSIPSVNEWVAETLSDYYYAYAFNVEIYNEPTEAYKPRLYFTCVQGSLYDGDYVSPGRIGVSISYSNNVLQVCKMLNGSLDYDSVSYINVPVNYAPEIIDLRVIAVVDKVLNEIQFYFYNASIDFPLDTSNIGLGKLGEYVVPFYNPTFFETVTFGCFDACSYDERYCGIYDMAMYRVKPSVYENEAHYQAGFDKGYADGYDDGEEYGYNYGYSLGQGGQVDVGATVDSITTGAVNMFKAMFDFEIFGINVAGTITAVLVIAIVAFVIRRLKQ